MSNAEREPNEAHITSGPPGMPAWLKISGAVVALVVLVVILVLIVGGGGGEHGPGRHGAEGTAATTSAGALG